MLPGGGADWDGDVAKKQIPKHYQLCVPYIYGQSVATGSCDGVLYGVNEKRHETTQMAPNELILSEGEVNMMSGGQRGGGDIRDSCPISFV